MDAEFLTIVDIYLRAKAGQIEEEKVPKMVPHLFKRFGESNQVFRGFLCKIKNGTPRHELLRILNNHLFGQFCGPGGCSQDFGEAEDFLGYVLDECIRIAEAELTNERQAISASLKKLRTLHPQTEC